MNIKKIIVEMIVDSRKRFSYLSELGFYNKMPDEVYLKHKYYYSFGKNLNIDNPITFNEKLQWLKLHDRKKIYTSMVDKYEVKKYVSDMIGDEYVIPTLRVWERFEDIDFDELPSQFVLKCTHDSGGVFVVKDKSKFDKKLIGKKIKRYLKRNYFYFGREWPYKNIKPRIIAEQYITNDSLDENCNMISELYDYKFFCFNGEVRCFKVDFDRFVNHKANYYDKEKNILEFGEAICPPDYTKQISFPKNIDKMIELAECLSKNIPFLRVDLYNVGGKIYFGELTFYPASGFGKFVPEKWDENIGKWLELPRE